MRTLTTMPCAFAAPLHLPSRTHLSRTHHSLSPSLRSRCTASAVHRDIVVIGAGIIGLTTAIRLRESGHNVSILAQECPSTIFSRPQSPNAHTPASYYTSSGSGGLWMPIFLDDPQVKKWSTVTYDVLSSHIQLDVGVGMFDNLLVYKSEQDMPWYSDLTQMRVVTPSSDARVPSKYHHAHLFRSPIVNAKPYLLHLETLLSELSIPLHLTRSHTAPEESTRWHLNKIHSFASQLHSDYLLINCAGIGADLLSDDTVIAGRGVVVCIKRPAFLDYSISEHPDNGFWREGELAYAIPKGELVTLGGTYQRGKVGEAEETEKRGVVARAMSLLEGEVEADVLESWAGLRPIRLDGTARVGVVEDGVVANYGHGGSGFTTCWGCAENVVEIVRSM